MQIPHHSLLLKHHSTRRPPAEATKYVRTEFGDNNPSWLLAETSNKGQVNNGWASEGSAVKEKIAPELPGEILMGDGCGADH